MSAFEIFPSIQSIERPRLSEKRQHFFLRGLAKFCPPLLAVSLFAGTLEATDAVPKARHVASATADAAQKIWHIIQNPPQLQPLPRITFEPIIYDSPQEQDIYRQFAVARTKSLQVAAIVDVLAVSRADVIAGEPIPLAMSNPYLMSSQDGTQYVVSKNNLAADTLKNLRIMPLSDVFFCPYPEGLPHSTNVIVDPNGHAFFRQAAIGDIIRDADLITNFCQTAVSIEAINAATVASATSQSLAVGD